MFKSLLVTMMFTTSIAYGYVNTEELSNATVMITNKGETGGGTGVILKSGPDKSLVLTNGHVCEVVSNGGLVHSSKRKVAVERFTKSDQHDLCMLEVVGDLGVNTDIASRAPKLMDTTYVAGHPYLFPTTVSQGHFSNSMIIKIILGVKKCTKEDFKKNAFYCMYFGGIPLIRELNTNTVSNLIAPGNSGSAVYNDSGEVIGLIFAGAGRGMSPGIIVPYEYVKSFVDSELKSGKLKTVETSVAKTITELENDESGAEADAKTMITFDTKDITSLKNLVFAAIKDTTLDTIETKLRSCKTETSGCLNLAY